jgi:hypothetical protein
VIWLGIGIGLTLGLACAMVALYLLLPRWFK